MICIVLSHFAWDVFLCAGLYNLLNMLYELYSYVCMPVCVMCLCMSVCVFVLRVNLLQTRNVGQP